MDFYPDINPPPKLAVPAIPLDGAVEFSLQIDLKITLSANH
jgi:hypothetical protein